MKKEIIDRTINPGMLFHDTIMFVTVKNCIVNTDLAVLTSLYSLIKKEEVPKLGIIFPEIVTFFDSEDEKKLSIITQNKSNANILLDYYDWGNEIIDSDPLFYTDLLYKVLEIENTIIEPVPTLLGNLLSIMIKEDSFKKLYLFAEEFNDLMRDYLNYFFHSSNKVELLEGTIEEALTEIRDPNFFILEDTEYLNFLTYERDFKAEVIIPGFRSNMLNADDLDFDVPVLAIPEKLKDYKNKYNLSVNAIAIPI